MSEHSEPNLSRASGTSGRGLLIALGVVVAIVALIALVGSFGTDAPGDSTIIPVAPATQAPSTAPTE